MVEHGNHLQELAKQQWLIPFLPLVAAAIQSLLPRGQRKLSAGICLLAMGASSADARSTLRFSLGHTSTQSDVDALADLRSGQA